MASYTYNLGNLTSTPIQRTVYQNTVLDESMTTHYYRFNTSRDTSINLNLHNITRNDDADLYLHRDVNANGVLDAPDQFVAQSIRSSNADDYINYSANAGSYIAVVQRYAYGSEGRLGYELDLSASHRSDLLPREEFVGVLPIPSLGGRKTTSYSGWVGDNDTADTYVFSIPDQQGFDPQTLRFYRPRVNISLTGLSSDADIRIIQDSNNNDIVDSGEVIGSSFNGGNSSELIPSIGIRGNELIVQVYQWSGDTNYQLNFETYWGLFIS